MSGETSLFARLDSSAVETARYDPGSRTLALRYAGGALYRYRRVPREVYDALISAPSAGEFVNREIKPRFAYEIEEGRRRFRPRLG
jgi:hypothetical protein